MSLFESVLASLVVALFMPLFVSLGKESVSLRLSAQSVESSISRDSFISESFPQLQSRKSMNGRKCALPFIRP
ncbi:MAG: hypothetical protein IKN34_02390 [Treponema sp.]|nr:hypothetical protein [Treponema sp.]